MTRIVVPRGSGGSSSNTNRPPPQHVAAAPAAAKEEDHSGHQEVEERARRKEEVGEESSHGGLRIEGGVDPSSVEVSERRRRGEEAEEELGAPAKGSDLSHLRQEDSDSVVVGGGCGGVAVVSSCPPPPPVPPPNASSPSAGTRRMGSGGLGTARNVSSRRQTGWPPLPAWGPQPESKPSSPKSFGDAEGYNSADEQCAYFGPPYCNPALECRTVLEDLGTRTSTEDITEDKEMMFEIEIKGVKGLEIKKMIADGNCLFRAVADQVYGDAELYDTSRQMCIDYMERERDHFSQFIVENFTAYCKRKRRDKIHGNNIEIQAFAEMYNRPIHIYCYSTEPINIFHGGYDTDTPPIRLSYHHGNHYNSLVDPRRLAIGAGLGLSSLRGVDDIDKDQVKAAIKAQQDQQIENALLAEGRFYSDLELTEREIERMVMEASRAEYLAEDRFKEQHKISSASAAAEPSSSGGRSSDTGAAKNVVQESTKVLSDSMNVVLAMGFSYLQAIEAYSIFGDDVDSMVCYLVETGASDSPGSSRQKGKAAE